MLIGPNVYIDKAMRVILAEKPSVAKDIARVLGCGRREDGFFIGKDDIVTYAIGHLVTLPTPENLNPAWGGIWHRGQLPMLPETWHYVALAKTKAQFDVVQRLFNAPETTSIINAADAGREGEAIFRRIYALSGSRKPVMRFWASSLTEEAIRKAFNSLRPSADYDGLAEAAQTRSEIDWLWGMNYSRAYTITNKTVCSIGRVQTPTLALIVERQAQITGFVKSSFYQVHATLAGFVALALNQEGKFDFNAKSEAESIIKGISQTEPAIIDTIQREQRTTVPPQLYNLGALQKDANNAFGYTAAETLEIAQKLYEIHKVLSYPRTSSRHLGTDMVPSFLGTLRAIEFPVPGILVSEAIARAENGVPLNRHYVDDSKLSDHHAIIPTRVRPFTLSQEERNVYELVAKRFLAVFLSDKQTAETKIGITIGQHKFAAKGSQVTHVGWSAVYPRQAAKADQTDADEPEVEQELPALEIGQRYPVSALELKTKQRKPPSRFTDATLIAAMESAGQHLEDEDLRAIMKGKGLGTEATRSAIIERLKQTEYVIRKGKFIEPTDKGIRLIEQVSPRIASPSLTADMEEKLHRIEQGDYSPSELRAEIEENLRTEIPQVLAAPAIDIPKVSPSATQMPCPRCKRGSMVQVKNKPFYGCSEFKNGCSYAINSEFAGKTLTEANIRQLCSPKAKTHIIKGFKSKSGKPFDAYVILDDQKKTKFEFEKRS